MNESCINNFSESALPQNHTVSLGLYSSLCFGEVPDVD